MTTSRTTPTLLTTLTTTVTATVGAGLLAATLTTAPASAAPAAAAADRDTPPLAIADPTGHHPVSTRTLHLVDRTRPDPWVPDRSRELMVTMSYPATTDRGPAARFTTRRESRAYLRLQERQGQPLPPEIPRDVLADVTVPATRGAEPAVRAGGRPLVVLSPGFSLPRSSLTGLATELASRGYVVASLDHAYEAAGIELPDGELLRCAACDTDDYAAIPRGREHDVRFVLDRLLRPGGRWDRLVDQDRVAMVGHSIGGNSASSAMLVDRRIDVGVNMDGTFFDPVRRDLDRPFLMLGAAGIHRPDGEDETWPRDWQRLTGPRTWLTVRDGQHFSFVDYPALIDQIGLGDPEDPLPGARELRLTRAYVGAFLDRHLRGRATPLLDGPSARFPEVDFHDPR